MTRFIMIPCLLLLAATAGVFGQSHSPQSKEGKVSAAKPAQFVTRADLENRVADLKQQLEQAKANLAAISGAIQDCEYWLDRMKEPQPKPEPQPLPKPQPNQPQLEPNTPVKSGG